MHNKKVIFILIALLLTSSSLSFAETKSSETQATKLIKQILEQDKGSGIMAAVYRNGKLVWSDTSGYSDLEANIKMQKNHRLRTGSVSKSITAILALKLAEQGKFGLDKSIKTYIPESQANLKGVTPRLLGSHIAGIRHYDFSNYLEANNVFYFPTLKESLKNYKNNLVVAKPKTKFLYSSVSFNILGMAIENATKNSFTEVLSNEIAKPLGLKNTLTDNSLAIIKDRGRFYTIGNPNPIFPWMKKDQIINTVFRDSSDYYPSGGILSTAEDLAKFTDKVFNSDFLSEKSQKIVKTPALLASGEKVVDKQIDEKNAYSFGWRIYYKKDGSVRFYGHNGETNGGYAIVRYFPDTKTSVAAVVNYNVVAKETVFFKLASEKLPQIFQAVK